MIHGKYCVPATVLIQVNVVLPPHTLLKTQGQIISHLPLLKLPVTNHNSFGKLISVHQGENIEPRRTVASHRCSKTWISHSLKKTTPSPTLGANTQA